MSLAAPFLRLAVICYFYWFNAGGKGVSTRQYLLDSSVQEVKIHHEVQTMKRQCINLEPPLQTVDIRTFT